MATKDHEGLWRGGAEITRNIVSGDAPCLAEKKNRVGATLVDVWGTL